MKNVFTCLWGFLLLCMPLEAAYQEKEVINSEEMIRVLLVDGVSQAELAVSGPYTLYDPAKAKQIAKRVMSKRRALRPGKEGLSWGEQFPGLYQFLLIPRAPHTRFVFNGLEYRGNLFIYQIGNRISVVNALDIENYLQSLLAKDYDTKYSDEVLSAVAIAARTEALYRRDRAAASFWHVKAIDVGYRGQDVVDSESPMHRAVARTHHFSLRKKESLSSAFFAARWTVHSAGKTAAFHSLFRYDGGASQEGIFLQEAKENRSQTKWSLSLSAKALARSLGMDSIDSLELYRDTFSSRVYRVDLRGKNQEKSFSFLAFRSILRANLGENLLSSDFSIEKQGDSFLFQGHGEGHGVGICLYTAETMAQKGKEAPEILARFFPNTDLRDD